MRVVRETLTKKKKEKCNSGIETLSNEGWKFNQISLLCAKKGTKFKSTRHGGEKKKMSGYEYKRR